MYLCLEIRIDIYRCINIYIFDSHILLLLFDLDNLKKKEIQHRHRPHKIILHLHIEQEIAVSFKQ